MTKIGNMRAEYKQKWTKQDYQNKNGIQSASSERIWQIVEKDVYDNLDDANTHLHENRFILGHSMEGNLT